LKIYRAATELFFFFIV